MNILFFGDSITWGAWDKEGGWVARIKRTVDQKIINTNFNYYNEIYNVGISGDLSTDLVERFELETNSRIDNSQDTVFIFAIGANDSMFNLKEKVYRTSPEIFQENITSLINKARKFSNKIIFIGLFPVDDNVTIPSSWPQNEIYKNMYTSEYSNMIKNICTYENIEFIDLFSIFIKMKYQKLLGTDGLHPNSEGHKQISEIILKYLIGKKYI